jgi:hypothetical protein
MLADAKNAEYLPEFLAQIVSADAKAAFRSLVGLAATDSEFICHGQMKGAVRDFRFFNRSGEQWFSFIVNSSWLLFYFRLPAVRSGKYALASIRAAFDSASQNTRGEWTVRLQNAGEVQRLWNLVQSNESALRSGSGTSTQTGYTNANNQRCDGHRGIAGTDHGQLSYGMVCLVNDCGHVYGANGSDIFERKCPVCQGGKPGIPY